VTKELGRRESLDSDFGKIIYRNGSFFEKEENLTSLIISKGIILLGNNRKIADNL
jgi:hypothetical protein